MLPIRNRKYDNNDKHYMVFILKLIHTIYSEEILTFPLGVE